MILLPTADGLCQQSGRRKNQPFFQFGFTLIELMMTIAVLAVLVTLAAPSFDSAILNGKLTSFANNFLASTRLARSEAIKRNAPVTLCRSNDGATCATSGGWEQGWIIVSGTTVILQQAALTSGYLLAGNAYSIAFLPDGTSATPATLKLCRSTPSPGSQDREIKISATGHASVRTTNTGVCS
jgi:type IV fimbrial biogenesis protein FimT